MSQPDTSTDTDEKSPPSEADESVTSPSEYAVPPEVDPHRCEYCGAPFTDPDLLALHRGLNHESLLSDQEYEAFQTAYDAENDEIRLFRLKALAVLVFLYFGLLMTFSVFA